MSVGKKSGKVAFPKKQLCKRHQRISLKVFTNTSHTLKNKELVCYLKFYKVCEQKVNFTFIV